MCSLERGDARHPGARRCPRRSGGGRWRRRAADRVPGPAGWEAARPAPPGGRVRAATRQPPCPRIRRPTTTIGPPSAQASRMAAASAAVRSATTPGRGSRPGTSRGVDPVAITRRVEGQRCAYPEGDVPGPAGPARRPGRATRRTSSSARPAAVISAGAVPAGSDRNFFDSGGRSAATPSGAPGSCADDHDLGVAAPAPKRSARCGLRRARHRRRQCARGGSARDRDRPLRATVRGELRLVFQGRRHRDRAGPRRDHPARRGRKPRVRSCGTHRGPGTR